jgi:hypothetical protein
MSFAYAVAVGAVVAVVFAIIVATILLTGFRQFLVKKFPWLHRKNNKRPA